MIGCLGAPSSVSYGDAINDAVSSTVSAVRASIIMSFAAVPRRCRVATFVWSSTGSIHHLTCKPLTHVAQDRLWCVRPVGTETACCRYAYQCFQSGQGGGPGGKGNFDTEPLDEIHVRRSGVIACHDPRRASGTGNLSTYGGLRELLGPNNRYAIRENRECPTAVG